MKALFIGLGSIGQRHLRNLKKLKPNIDFLAVRSNRSAPVLSSNNEVIKSVSIKKHYGIKEFDSIEEALIAQPEIVFITNPTSLHISAAKLALESGAFVFIEKPLSHNFEGVEDLIQIEEKFGKNKIFVGYQFRFNPALKFVEELLLEKKIGNIISAHLINGEYLPNWHKYEDYRLSYASREDLGGGAILTQIHDFDYAIWLFGKPRFIFAVGGHLSDLEINVEDSVQVLMKSGDIPISIQLDYLQWPPKRNISIIGDMGSINCDLTSMIVEVNMRSSESIESHNFPNYNRNDLFIDEMKNFLDFIDGYDKPAVNLLEGVDSLRLALAAKESMRSGKLIELSWS